MPDIDELSIKIEAESTQAAERVNSLASALERLQSVVKGKGLADAQKQIAGIGASAESATKTQKKQQILSSAKEMVFGAGSSDVVKAGAALDSIDSKIERAQRKIDALQDKMYRLLNGPQTSNTASLIEDTNKRLNEQDTIYQSLLARRQELSDQITSGEIPIKVNTKEIEKATQKVGILSRALSAIKRIAFYRVIRAGMKIVSEAFSTGLNNLYQYSKALKGEFADKMDMLATSALYLKNSLGAMVSPLINTLAPVVDILVDKFVDLLNIINQVFAALSGKTTYTKAIKQTQEYAEAANGAAKAVKSFQLGIDELNVIEPTTGGAGGASQDFSSMFEEMEIEGQWADVAKGLKDILPIVGAIGAGIATWKVSNSLLTGLEKLKKKLSGLGMTKTVSIGFSAIGLVGFLSDMEKFSKFFDDYQTNGPTFKNVVGMLSEFIGGVGDVALIAGDTSLGGLLKIVQGVGEIIVAIKDMWDNGVNWDNAKLVINGITDIGIGVGAMTGDWKLAGVSLAVQGLTDIVTEIGKNWDAIKNGDWSGVDKSVLLIGAIKAIAGVAAAFGLLEKVKGLFSASSATSAVQEVATATESVNSPLKDLAKNLAWGIVIIAEVAIAAAIIIGSIQLMGRQLEDVGKAWQPVIDNGESIATAVAIGTGILVAIGLASALLGKATEGSGGTIALDIGIGIAVLAEVGIAAGLFLIEIETVGNKLADIKKAWEPINGSGEEIANDIAIGTALLVGIGVVAAGIGAVSVATGLALPAMIAVGTGVLLELAGAFILFIDSIADVADQLGDRLAPALADLNPKIPPLTTNMSRFTFYISELSEEIADYTTSMGSITWSSIVSAFQKLFAGNPIQDMANDVKTIKDDTANLNEKLTAANPELQTAVNLMQNYSDLMDQLQPLTEKNGAVNLGSGMYTNMKDVGQKLVNGLVAGIDAKKANFDNKMASLKNTITSNMSAAATSANSSIQSIIDKLNAIPRNISTTVNVSQSGSATIGAGQFASGGFPTTGQMFIAREAGPELVGNIGGKTAVANNSQIEAGIEEAAYRGFMRAMAESGGQSQQPIVVESKLYLDGKQVTSSVEKTQRERGASIMVGGVMQ